MSNKRLNLQDASLYESIYWEEQAKATKRAMARYNRLQGNKAPIIRIVGHRRVTVALVHAVLVLGITTLILWCTWLAMNNDGLFIVLFFALIVLCGISTPVRKRTRW